MRTRSQILIIPGPGDPEDYGQLYKDKDFKIQMFKGPRVPRTTNCLKIYKNVNKVVQNIEKKVVQNIEKKVVQNIEKNSPKTALICEHKKKE